MRDESATSSVFGRRPHARAGRALEDGRERTVPLAMAVRRPMSIEGQAAINLRSIHCMPCAARIRDTKTEDTREWEECGPSSNGRYGVRAKLAFDCIDRLLCPTKCGAFSVTAAQMTESRFGPDRKSVV